MSTETENEDLDPVGWVSDPRAEFTQVAVQHGLIPAGAELSPGLFEFALGVSELCARIGDGYGDSEAGGNAGEHIRAVYGDN